MTLRLKLALVFAIVAIATATAVAILTPSIVSRGFERVQADDLRRPAGQGLGPGPRAGARAGQVQEETTYAIVAIAALAAAGASVLGIIVAGRLIRPLDRLRTAAADVASGDLGRRSGLADRSDEIGELGRSFDSMAEALERSDLARRRLFQDAAHELKTPLTVIDATTTAILEGVYQHDDRHLETIRQQSRLLGRIVDDLRTVSLAESGAMPLHIASLPVDAVLEEVAQGFAARAELGRREPRACRSRAWRGGAGRSRAYPPTARGPGRQCPATHARGWDGHARDPRGARVGIPGRPRQRHRDRPRGPPPPVRALLSSGPGAPPRLRHVRAGAGDRAGACARPGWQRRWPECPWWRCAVLGASPEGLYQASLTRSRRLASGGA